MPGLCVCIVQETMAQMPLLECDSLFSGNSNREATLHVISRVCSIEETMQEIMSIFKSSHGGHFKQQGWSEDSTGWPYVAYTKKSTRQTGITLVELCSLQAKAIQCKGSLKTSLTLDSPEIGTPHNHDPNQANMEVAKAKVNLKQLARVTREKLACSSCCPDTA